MIAALLLAAGRASRFGDDKLTASLGNRPVVRWSAEAVHGVVDRTIVVITPTAVAVRSALAGLDVTFIQHAGHDEGMGSSIRAGIASLSPDVDAVVISLADQPLVARATVRLLCDRWRTSHAAAVAPLYADGRGHPVLFDRACFPALESLQGDSGARALLDALGNSCELVDVDTPMPLDVDTPALLREVEQQLSR